MGIERAARGGQRRRRDLPGLCRALALACLMIASAAPAEADVEATIVKLGDPAASTANPAYEALDRKGSLISDALVSHLDENWVSLQDRVASLIEQLDHRAWRARERATQALVEIGAGALEALAEAAKSDSLEVRQRAKTAMADIQKGAAGSAGRLAKRRIMIARLLAEHVTDSELARRVLVSEMKASAPEIEPLAATALGRLGEMLTAKEIAALMAVATSDKRLPATRERAIWALSQAAPAKVAIDRVLALAGGKASGYLRRCAILACDELITRGKLKLNKASTQALVARLSDDCWEVREAASAALARSAGTDHGYRYASPAGVRAKAVEAWTAWAGKQAD